MINIKYITAKDKDFFAVKEIRVSVFINEQGALADEEFDAFDEEDSLADFVLLYDDDKPFGTARVINNDKGFKIGRIAILREYRGRGFGDTVVRAIMDKAFEKGAQTIFVDAQNYAVPFYEKIGFKVIGEEIIDRGLSHIPMAVDKCDVIDK